MHLPDTGFIPSSAPTRAHSIFVTASLDAFPMTGAVIDELPLEEHAHTTSVVFHLSHFIVFFSPSYFALFSNYLATDLIRECSHTSLLQPHLFVILCAHVLCYPWLCSICCYWSYSRELQSLFACLLSLLWEYKRGLMKSHLLPVNLCNLLSVSKKRKAIPVSGSGGL
jgi:hypothetical protein